MIHPDDTFTIFLDDIGQDKPDDGTRPAIVCRYGTAADDRRFDQSVEHALQLNDVAEMATRLDVLICGRVVTTRNVKRPADHLSLAEHLTTRDLRSLASAFTAFADLLDTDRKKSESPSRTDAAASAGPATQPEATPGVSTDPAQPSPSKSNAPAAKAEGATTATAGESTSPIAPGS